VTKVTDVLLQLIDVYFLNNIEFDVLVQCHVVTEATSSHCFNGLSFLLEKNQRYFILNFILQCQAAVN